MRRLIAFLLALAAAGAAHGQPSQPPRWIHLATASLTGVYFGVGGGLCRVVNQYRAEHGLRCSVESGSGSIENIQAILDGEVELGIVESSVHYHAVKGDEQYKVQGPATRLRSVMSLHPEPYTVVARKESGIKSFADIKGKRFNVGERGTVTRTAVSQMLEALGWSEADFAPAPRLSADQSGVALCENRIDGYFLSIGHPTPLVQLPTAVCGAKLVPLVSPEIDRYIKAHPYLSHSTIAGGLYAANPQETRSFGVRATLMASAAVPADDIYVIVRTLFENFHLSRRQHPALDSLRADTMVNEGLTAPLHEGAARLYREKGWIR